MNLTTANVLAVTIDGDSAVAVLRDAATWLEEHPNWFGLDVVLGGDDRGTFLVLYAEKGDMSLATEQETP